PLLISDQIQQCPKSGDFALFYDPQINYLLFGKVAPMPSWQIFFGKYGIHHSIQFYHYVSQGLKNTLYDLITVTLKFHPYFLSGGIINIANLIYPYHLAIDRNAVLYFLQVFAPKVFIEFYMEDFSESVFWGGKSFAHFPIIGKQ